MVSSRKRGLEQMEESASVDVVVPPKEPGLLQQIRNTWEFANLAQWIFIFGRAVKIDEDLDIDELEMECLKNRSTVLPEIGLALLKFVSSHRGLTPEIFDEYTRRQYVAKAPQRNPFGIEEDPAKFNDFDIFTKLRVLQQLSQWTLGNPDRIRERMEEQKDAEQTIWRIEPFGWDSEDRTYFILDDNRLYRRTDPPPPPAPKATKSKKKSKKTKASIRASKRRKVSEPLESDTEHVEEPDAEDPNPAEKEDDGFGGMKWECIAVTFDEVHAFVSSIEKSRDPNEKILCKRVKDDLLPLLEKQEEARKRKAAQKERELLNLEKLATAKRSSRIAAKTEHQKAEDDAREAERKKQMDLVMAKKEQEKWTKLEKERESRMMTREQRVKERDARRILHEDELANLSEDSKKIEAGTGRLSERHLKAEIERKKQALEELAEDDDWIFDCICGAYGQIDDGTHSISCEKCNVWQHSKCLKVSQAEAERDDFHFICSTCTRRAKEAERPKTQPIKITLKRPTTAASPSGLIPNGSSPSQALPPMGHFKTSTQLPQQSPSKPRTHSAYSGQPVTYQAPYVPAQAPLATPQIEYNSSVPSVPQTSISNGRVGQSGAHSPFAAGPSLNTKLQSPFVNNVSNFVPRPTSSHAFSSPRLESPTSLPPPVQHVSNGNALSHVHNMPNTPTGFSTSQHIGSPSRPATFSQSAYVNGTPAPRSTNGSQHLSNNTLRRNSMTFSSPAPVLTPVLKPIQPAVFPSSPPIHGTPQPILSPKAPPNSQNQDPSSLLPPVATGYSPTKHSPPRPSTSNGSFGSATPTILPPVASLSPSPHLQNLSPPVKPSDPEPFRELGQGISSPNTSRPPTDVPR